jgi:PAS domain S-box-containing protein
VLISFGLTAAIVVAATAYLPFAFLYIAMALIGCAMWLNMAGLAVVSLLTSLVVATMIAWGYFVLPPMTSRWSLLFSYVPFFLEIAIPLLLSASMSSIVAKDRARVAAETTSRELSLRLQKIALRVPGMLYQYQVKADGSEIFPYASDGIQDIYQVTPAEAQGDAKKLFQKIHPDDQQRYLQSAQESAQTLNVWKLDYRVCHIDGTVRWVSGNAQPQRGADGSTLWHGFITDITDRKTADLLLEQAVKDANAANEAKSRFLANMSHELRTPMNGVLGMAQMLMASGLTLEQQQLYARTILSSGRMLLKLLNDILDLSKVEAGKVELESLVFQPQQLIHETALLFTNSAVEKGLNLQEQWGGANGLRFRGDAHRLRQMLFNLVSNGLKFTKHGFVRIEGAVIEELEPATATTEAKVLLEFSATDSGIGIPQDKVDRLFKPFTQVDSSVTREHGGTGLGLSIVSALARQMGGSAGIDNTLATGARVWFRLSASLVAIGDDTRHSVLAAEPTKRTPDATPRSTSGQVLVVEDVPLNRMVIGSLLTREGVAFTCVENGEIALAAIMDGAQPDLVLVDCQMPVMDGYTATKKIREWELAHGKSRLPIVALTADAFEEDRKRCIAVGMDDFLAKPLDFAQLNSILKKWGLIA